MRPPTIEPSTTAQHPAVRAARRRTRTVVVGLDVLVCVVSVITATLIRWSFEKRLPDRFWSAMWVFVPGVAAARILVNHLLGVYRMVWRYVGLRETVELARAVGAVSAALLAIRLLLGTENTYVLLPWGVILLEGVFTFIGMTGMRFLPRILSEWGGGSTDSVPTLLAGAGEGGLAIAKQALKNPDLGIRPIGYLDDDRTKAEMAIHGVRVLGRLKDAGRVIRKTDAAQVIITTGAIPSASILVLMDECRALSVAVRIVPTLYELLGKPGAARSLREVRIEDLLGRDPIPPSLSMSDLTRRFGGKRVLVTGAGGSIGSELCRQLRAMEPAELLLVERDETSLFHIHRELAPGRPGRADDAVVPLLLDITADDLEAVFGRHRPEVVFHAAAFKHVAMMERFPHEALRNNVLATHRLAALAEGHGVESFAMISTDKAVHPSSVMGASKRLAEKVIQHRAATSSTRFSCVRFGNVLGSRGSVVEIFRDQIARGGPVTVTHPDATRYFMTIPEAANLVIQASTLGATGEVFMLDMGEPVRILDLARQMIRLSGASERDLAIEVIGTRPGEKLVEELRTTREDIAPTPLRKVFKCTPEDIADMDIPAMIEDVQSLVRAADGDAIRAFLAASRLGYEPHAATPPVADAPPGPAPAPASSPLRPEQP